MIAIHSKQMECFHANSLACFIDDMKAHCRDFSPRLCHVLGESQLHLSVCDAIVHAKQYGFINTGPVQFYIDLVFLFGSHFDDDPMFTEFANILNDDSNQMFRADQMYELTSVYLDKVHGPDNVNIDQALVNLNSMLFERNTISEEHFIPDMMNKLTSIFPERATFVGDKALISLIHRGQALAVENQFSAIEGATLFIVLMCAFGHGCSRDPLYPWISNTLVDERIVDSEARAKRLKKKAITWLNKVIESRGLESKV